MTGKLQYVEGDATQPQGVSNKAILHICNDVGAWGAGFVVALSKRWRQPENTYRDTYFARGAILGTNQWVEVQAGIYVVSMIAQHGLINDSPGGRSPIRYGALSECLKDVFKHLGHRPEYTIHAPRFGSGLAGGHWPTIEALILEHLVDNGMDVTIYDLPPDPNMQLRSLHRECTKGTCLIGRTDECPYW